MVINGYFVLVVTSKTEPDQQSFIYIVAPPNSEECIAILSSIKHLLYYLKINIRVLNDAASIAGG